jgi:hypothetical protein
VDGSHDTSQLGSDALVRVKELGVPQKKRKISKGDAKGMIVVDLTAESEDEDEENASMMQIAESSQAGHENTQLKDRGSLPPALMSSQITKYSRSSVAATTPSQTEPDLEPTIKVVNLAWYNACVAAGQLLPLDGYLVYEGKPIAKPSSAAVEPRVVEVGKLLLLIKLEIEL